MMSASLSSPIELLQAMVAIDSVNGRISRRPAAERPLADFLQSVAQAWGLVTHLLPVDGEQSNLLITPPRFSSTAPHQKVLLLEAHLDTVSVEGMTISPFAPELREGRLYGRGSCDTKASGAAMLWALRAAAAQHPDLPAALLFTVDEEVGKAGIETFVREHLPLLAWSPFLALVGEPTLLAPVIAHNGAVRWEIETTGQPAHSSNPARGRSAISDMVRVIEELESHYIPSLTASHPLTGRAVCSINQIHGGRQANMIPDACTIVIDRRLVPGEKASDVLPAVERHLQKLRTADPSLRVEQKRPFFDPPLAPLESEAILEVLREPLQSLGLATAPLGMPYGTDAANLGAAGIPTVVIGPGDIAQAHTVDEWIAVDQFEKGVQFFGKVLQQWATRAE